jgi:hypothetical protein
VNWRGCASGSRRTLRAGSGSYIERLTWAFRNSRGMCAASRASSPPVFYRYPTAASFRGASVKKLARIRLRRLAQDRGRTRSRSYRGSRKVSRELPLRALPIAYQIPL